MKIIRSTLALAFISVLASCAGPAASKLTPAVSQAISGHSLTTTNGEPPPLVVTTAGQVMAQALVGIAVGATSGNPGFASGYAGTMVGEQGHANMQRGIQVTKELQLADPAVNIAKALAADLAKSKGMKVAPKTGMIVGSLRKSKILEAAVGADYVLDVRVPMCTVIYMPLHWTKYRLVSSVQLSLIDVKTRKTVLKGVYFGNTTKWGGETTNYDGIKANDAAWVRKQLETLEAKALEHFRKEVFSL